MSKDMLLEIGVEEIPSALMKAALDDLKSIAVTKFQSSRIGFTDIATMGTPRRLVLHVKGLEERQEDSVAESRGPKKSSAYNPDGTPSKAAQGFARSQGIDVSELRVKDEYVYAVKQETGVLTEELLPNLITEVICSLNFPRSMRWGYYLTRFARPIRWLLVMFGDKMINITIENVGSAGWTMGHRFLAPEPIPVNSISDYFAVLRDNFVIVDHKERMERIWSQVKEVADIAGGAAKENEDLLEEVTFLVEYPTAFYGRFSESYLEVPPEVLTTSMIGNQRYFPVFDKNDQLMAGFIGVRNGTDYYLDQVRSGNERVLKARLEDALFFWKEDTSQPLSELVPGLKDVLFHERLGSVFEKVECLRKLAVILGNELGLSSPDKLDRAALLCKADLLSNMVYEFPELQGIMGRYYALHGNEDKEVAEAIVEHYLPRFAGDGNPRSATGIALALAEKLFNLTAFFALGIKPSGSQDPYALRRQALGIVNIILDAGIRIDLRSLIVKTHNLMDSFKLDVSADNTAADLMDFILQRMRGFMLDKGYSYDVIDAVLYQGNNNLLQIVDQAEAVSQFKNAAEWEDFLVVFNRSHNLSKKWESRAVVPEVLIDESEKVLYNHYLQVKPVLEKLIQEGGYTDGLKLLAELRMDVDSFFEAVMVMVEDEELRAARLGILKSIAGLCNSIADFTRVVS